MEQAIIIEFAYGLKENEPFYNLSEKLSVLVEESGLGAYDGHEMAEDNSYGSYYIYGQDAKALYEVIKKTLEETLFIAGANVTLRFGPPEKGVKEVSFILNLN